MDKKNKCNDKECLAFGSKPIFGVADSLKEETAVATADHKVVSKPTGVRAIGNTVLVELLTAQESYGTKLTINGKTQSGAPQGYILNIGSAVDSTWGLKTGDRVILQGTYVPAPNFNHSEREKAIVDVFNIKAVIDEE